MLPHYWGLGGLLWAFYTVSKIWVQASKPFLIRVAFSSVCFYTHFIPEKVPGLGINHCPKCNFFYLPVS